MGATLLHSGAVCWLRGRPLATRAALASPSGRSALAIDRCRRGRLHARDLGRCTGLVIRSHSRGSFSRVFCPVRRILVDVGCRCCRIIAPLFRYFVHFLYIFGACKQWPLTWSRNTTLAYVTPPLLICKRAHLCFG